MSVVAFFGVVGIDVVFVRVDVVFFYSCRRCRCRCCRRCSWIRRPHHRRVDVSDMVAFVFVVSVVVVVADIVAIVVVVVFVVVVVVVDVVVVMKNTDLYSPLTSITSSVVPRMLVAWHLYTP